MVISDENWIAHKVRHGIMKSIEYSVKKLETLGDQKGFTFLGGGFHTFGNVHFKVVSHGYTTALIGTPKDYKVY